MNSLQYDSFYKFLVSVGIVLIVAPIAGTYYLVCNGDQLLITQLDYEGLTPESMQIVDYRNRIALSVASFLPIVCKVLVLVGLLFLAYGGYKWHGIQIELDAQVRLKTLRQRLDYDNATAFEIAEDAATQLASEEQVEIEEDNAIDSPIKSKHYVDYRRIGEASRVQKLLQVERKVFSCVSQQMSKYYEVQSKIKIGDTIYDIVAFSKRGGPDVVFEVRYWPRGTTKKLFIQTINAIVRQKENYDAIAQSDCKAVLLIIVGEEHKCEAESICEKIQKEYSNPVEIKIVPERLLD